jgi:hypothetical protein
MLEKALEAILILVVIGSTLAFGGVESPAYSLMEAGVFFCLLLLLIRQTRQGRISLQLPVCPVLFVAWVILQLIPLSRGVVGILSPQRAEDVGPALVSQNLHTSLALSIYSHDTLIGLFKLLAYLCAFVLAA